MKKLSIFLFFISLIVGVSAQDSTSKKLSKSDKKEAKRQKINTLIRQAEDGELIFHKQSIFGFQGRTNGYGVFYELGFMKTNRKTNIFRLDLTEIKHQKEEKLSSSGGNIFAFNNPFFYGKVNNFYQATLGFGQQHMLGNKGNKNGVSVALVYNGGLALGLLKPYYLDVQDPSDNTVKTIKYSQADSALFLGPTIQGGAGFGKGWGELKIKPGAFVKTALRFDYGRFNESVSGIEVGVSAEFYGSKIPILANQKDRNLFFQGYIAISFGRRK